MQQPDWAPVAGRDTLRARAMLLRELRSFFADRDVLEVGTPLLSSATVPDPAIPAMTAGTADGRRWLHTSPEFPMKRLLAAGSGDIYQICPVFRDGERGRWHNPEFTLLEWYRLGLDDYQLASEAAALVVHLVRAGGDSRPLEDAPEWLSYREAFQCHAGVDPHADSDERIAETCIEAVGTGGPLHWKRSDWLDLLGSVRVFPALGRGRVTILTDFPRDQAALARIRPGDPPTAARFELFLDGVELANGFHELTDADEQRRRFDEENHEREAAGLSRAPIDERLLSAMAAGLPDCAGIALGLDRLLAIALGRGRIDDVLAFPWERA